MSFSNRRRVVRKLALSLLGVGLLAGVATQGLASSALRGATTPRGAPEPNFLGTVAMFNCSAALVRWQSSKPRDLALVLTNGHCYQASDKDQSSRHHLIRPAAVDRQVIVNRRDTRAFTLLRRNGSDLVTLRASRVLYSTSFRTDVGLYRLRLSYAQIRHRYHVPALLVAPRPPPPAAAVLVPSSFSQRVYSCTLNGFAYRLFNDTFDWRHSLRFTRARTCRTIHGTSGSPVIDPRTRVVLGVNNAINVKPADCRQGRVCRHGGRILDCSFSLCEKTKGGRVTQHVHRRYGQQTWWLTTCINGHRVVDLDLPGCLLPKPRNG